MQPSTKQPLSIDSLILTPAEQEALELARKAAIAAEGMLACDEQLARIDSLLAALDGDK